MRRRVIMLSCALTALGLIAASPVTSARTAQGAGDLSVSTGPLTLSIAADPFDLTVSQDGEVVLETSAADPLGLAPGPLSFAVGAALEAHQLGYSVTEQLPIHWFSATSVTDVIADERGNPVLTLATDDPFGRTIGLTIATPSPGTVRLEAALSDTSGILATGAAFENADDQHFLGFGERSDGADQTGRLVTTWNEEGPFSGGDLAVVTDPIFGERWQGPAFFPGSNFTMPWFVSSRGYGFLSDTDWLNGFDLGATDPARWTTTTREPGLTMEIIAGPTPAEVIRRFTDRQGRQPEPAPWFFGPWVQPGPGPEHFRDNDVPVTVAQTYTHYLPCAAQSGSRDGQKANTAKWHDQGFMVTTYVNSFVCAFHPDGAYDTADDGGWFLKSSNTGQTYRIPYVAYLQQDGPWHGVIDFTIHEAGAFWQGLIFEALEDGYDGWMEDFGEYMPVDAVTADGRSGLEYHNRYCTDYHRASHQLTWPEKGRNFAQFVRCGYTGTAPYARIVWGGDPSEDFSKADGLGAAVSQAISMGMSGIAYWGSDIGGFHAIQHLERTDAELQTRWVQFGALSGIMRTQRTGYPRPGPIDTYLNERAEVFGEEVEPAFRKFAKLRTQLYPELWSAAMRYQRDGLPMMRHLGLMFPDDPTVWSPEAKFEFMLGDDLLVAPVITEGARERTLHLPPGEWVNFWDAVGYDEVSGSFRRTGPLLTVDGGGLVTVDAPLDQIPMFVRSGACLHLLPADVDTLADVGLTAEGVRGLAEVAPSELIHLDFGGCRGSHDHEAAVHAVLEGRAG